MGTWIILYVVQSIQSWAKNVPVLVRMLQFFRRTLRTSLQIPFGNLLISRFVALSQKLNDQNHNAGDAGWGEDIGIVYPAMDLEVFVKISLAALTCLIQ